VGAGRRKETKKRGVRFPLPLISTSKHQALLSLYASNMHTPMAQKEVSGKGDKGERECEAPDKAYTQTSSSVFR
jgi:hypothetical protein